MEWAAAEKPTRVRTMIGIALLTATGGCADAFGIDDPALASCAHGACDGGAEAGLVVDATLGDATDASATSEAAAEQDSPDEEEVDTDAADAAPPAGWQGVRCGAGTLRCTGVTPDCCETFSDAGTAYTCVSPSSCSGYLIECGSAAECLSPGYSCCHYASALKCEPPKTCASTLLACDPAVDGGCPSGESCKTPALNEGQPSPYFTCAP
jgi:hypothetical protein